MEPFRIRLVGRHSLAGEKSGKRVYHLSFEFPEEIDYLPGDALAVYPENSPNEVAILMQLIGVPQDAAEQKILQKQLCTQYDIQHPSDALLKTIRERLQHPERFDAYGDGLKTLPLYELLPLFLEVHLTAEELLPLLKKLRPRLYSITSAKRYNPEQLDLIVAEVFYENCLKKLSYGVASRYLCETVAVGESITGNIINSRFKLPSDPERDVIMVGPGTGIAPFRSFLQERAVLKREGVNVGRNWLFFGEQYRDSNFYYQSDLEALMEGEVLTHLSLAFSRDQERKIYVQDRMKESAAELWQWIEKGAAFYICGDAKHMAVDVQVALLEIIRAYGKTENPEVYLDQLKKEGRYQRDVY